MKKKNLKSLKLTKKSVSNLKSTIKGKGYSDYCSVRCETRRDEVSCHFLVC